MAVISPPTTNISPSNTVTLATKANHSGVKNNAIKTAPTTAIISKIPFEPAGPVSPLSPFYPLSSFPPLSPVSPFEPVSPLSPFNDK
jgi:hypothetical protein